MDKSLFLILEMAEFMKKVAMEISGSELTVEERNLLSVAYKNVIGARRAAWRIISSLEGKPENSNREIIKNYKAKIEKELNDICEEILKLLDEYLIPNATNDDESSVFFYKM